MIRLFTTIYPESDERRRIEFRKCFQKNLACGLIEEICLLSEGGEELLPNCEKVKIRRVPNRPTFEAYFNWISELAKNSDISIIANTDIYFDQQLALFSQWNLPRDTVFALSRWDYVEGVKPKIHDRKDSQDAWVLKGLPWGIFGDFHVGLPRCDNRIAAEFDKAGYHVLNPSFSLRCFHVHQSLPREYLESEHSEEIPPPYRYIWPHNLFGLFRTLMHNSRHPKSHLYWRWDRRKFACWFPIRVLSRIARILKLRQ